MSNHTVRYEWMVTGDPGPGYPHYRFVFGSPTRLAMGEDDNPEAAARAFVEGVKPPYEWVDGPHLHWRMITETPWEPID